MNRLIILTTLLASYISAYQKEDLFKAINNNNTIQVHTILQANPQLANTEADDGDTPLHRAIMNNNIDIIQQLINAGANINAQNYFGLRPLHSALLKQDEKVVELLIKKNADVNSYDGHGRSPLHIAVERNNPQMVQLLLNANAHSTPHDIQGRTPLHYAAEKGNTDIVKLLLNANAHINYRNNLEHDPLHTAIMHGKKDVVSLLLAQPNIHLELGNNSRNHLRLAQETKKYWESIDATLGPQYEQIILLIKQAIN